MKTSDRKIETSEWNQSGKRSNQKGHVIFQKCRFGWWGNLNFSNYLNFLSISFISIWNLRNVVQYYWNYSKPYKKFIKFYYFNWCWYLGHWRKVTLKESQDIKWHNLLKPVWIWGLDKWFSVGNSCVSLPKIDAQWSQKYIFHSNKYQYIYL